MITKAFIRNWQSKYELEAGDDTDYGALVKLLAQEATTARFNFSTIVQVVDWKASRIKGLMDFTCPEKYCAFVRLAYDTANRRTKLWILTSLEGWGIPMASTMLHFLHPNRFPIVDYRVLQVLRDRTGFIANRDTEKGYWRYYSEIHYIMRTTGCRMREIDRALWAFHKKNYRDA